MEHYQDISYTFPIFSKNIICCVIILYFCTPVCSTLPNSGLSRLKEKRTYHTSAPVITVRLSSYLVRQIIQRRLTYGLLAVFLQNYFLVM